MKIPAQCLTVRIKADGEGEWVSKDEIGKVFAIKAVGWKKSTPIVKFKSAREDGQPGETDSSVPAPTGLASRDLEETDTIVKIVEKKDGGPFDNKDSTYFNVPLQSVNRKGSSPDESPSIEHFQQQVPDCPSAQNNSVRIKIQDQDSTVHQEKKPQDTVTDNASIAAVQPTQNVSSRFSEIGSLTLVMGRVQKVYVVHFESPANFYVTPSLEKLKEFQK